MKLTRVALLTMCTGVVAGCGGDLLGEVTETTAALETAQADFCAVKAAADQCRSDYDACILGAGADTQACRGAFHACLPRPPDRRGGGPRGGAGQHCIGRGDGGVRPPPPRLPGGHRGGPRGGVSPEPAAVEACRVTLAECLAATPGDASCIETERACIRTAFQAAFDAACADAAAGCTQLPAGAPAGACERLQRRCAEGPEARHAVDAGVCVETVTP